MKILSNISLTKKIILLLSAVSIIVFTTTSTISAIDLYNKAIGEKTALISAITETGLGLLKEYVKRVQTGELTEQDAKNRAAKRISNLTYNGGNYIWINDYDNNFIAHPKLQGQSGADLTDKNGVKIIAEATRIAKEKGED